MADEATDSTNTEQLSISVRFVDGGAHEKFLGFLPCESGVTGDAIAQKYSVTIGPMATTTQTS